MRRIIETDDLPQTWKTKQLGEVLQLNYGKGLSVQNRRPGSIPVYGSNGIVGFHNSALVQGPGVIVGRKGSAGEVHLCSGPFYPIDTTYYITPQDAPGTDIEFLYYLLKHLDLKRIKGDVGVPGLNREMAYLEPVSLPSEISEQKAIAHTLSTVQRAIAAQERIIQTTTELKKALMQKLFTEGLRGEPQKETEIGLVPESWEVVELDEKADSFQYGTSVKCGHDVEGKPVLRIPNVVGGHVDISDLKFGKPKRNELGKLELEPGDLLFVRTNGVKENAGRCSIFYGELADCYFASYLIRARLDPAILNPSFLNMYSRTDVGTSFLSGKAIRTADGKFNINSGTLKSMLVPVPPIEEQEEIARTLEIVNKKTNNAFSRKSRLQELFSTLLHGLMTAQARVQRLEFSNSTTAITR